MVCFEFRVGGCEWPEFYHLGRGRHIHIIRDGQGWQMYRISLSAVAL